MMKNYFGKYILLIAFMTTTFYSCISYYEPKEGQYNNCTYEEMLIAFGDPKYDFFQTITKNYEPNFIDPDYSLYFTKQELENGVKIRKLKWENNNNILIIWLKNNNGQWIVFDSLEYNDKHVQF
jgi:hypothetical protein